jgi:Flp pilus assembly pilin Flp
MTSRARSFLRRIEGQTMVEYAVVLAVVTSASVFLYPVLGSRIIGVVNMVRGLLP